MRLVWPWLVFGALAACTTDSFVVVTVDARPAVQNAAALKITLANAGTNLTNTRQLDGHTFPVTFSVSAPGRSGAIDLTVEADDANGLPIGLGAGSATVDAKTAEVMLDTTDFVVNTEYAMDQFLAEGDYEAAGLQLAAASDGSWITGFRDNCNNGTACNIYGRKLDQNGVPQSTVLGAGTDQFVASTDQTTADAYPAVASNGTNTLVFWDFTDPVTSTLTGVACRPIDMTGAPISDQVTISTDAADVVTATALSNGNFAVSWQIYSPTAAIRTTIVKPDCTQVLAPINVSTTVGTVLGPAHSHVVSNASSSSMMYTWIVDNGSGGAVHVRPGTNTGPSGGDIQLLTPTAAYEAEIARLTPMGTGFGLVVRWGNPNGTGPGKIELFQLDSAGAIQGGATLITDQSLSDFFSGSQSFGVATLAGGLVLISWHVCDAAGTTGTCDVFGQFVNPDGTINGTVFEIPTTTLGDQTGPSVLALPSAFAVAWTDQSQAPPDTQGMSVRARIVYPPATQ
jgi:hypothetical protein